MEIVAIIENSAVFKTWHAQHSAAYLVHIFAMQRGTTLEKQAGYYDPKTKDITTFIDVPKVMLTGSDKSFKEDDTPIERLDLSTVKTSLEEALEKAGAIVTEHYSAHNITQQICILQHLEKQLWNLTLISQSFNMINIRIDAQTGEVISHEIHSLMDLGTSESAMGKEK